MRLSTPALVELQSLAVHLGGNDLCVKVELAVVTGGAGEDACHFMLV